MLCYAATVLGLAGLALGSVSVEVQRTVDLTTQLTKARTELTVTNMGPDAVSHLLVAVEKMGGHLAYTRVVNDKMSLIMNRVEDANVTEEAEVYEVRLAKPLEPAAVTKLVVRSVVTHGQMAYPKEIAQNDNQYMVFTGNNYVLSPYTVSSQTTVYKVAGGIESHHADSGLGQEGRNEIKMSHDTPKKPYTRGSIWIHFKSNVPHITVYEMVREITVSHWSRIRVDEIVKVSHDGAKLKGFFARADYMKNPNPPAVVKGWVTKLPLDVQDVDYRDDVGNVTTSNLQAKGSYVELALRPRFPLFGGWNSDYMLNYSLPSGQFLSRSGQRHTLRMPLVSHVMDNMVIDRLTVRVAVPEGARNIQFRYKFPVDSQSMTSKTTYLDTVGRPTVVVTKTNVVGEHGSDFEVTYDFAPSAFLQEPALLIGFYFAFFLLTIVWVRLDFSIYGGPEETKKKR